MSDTLNHEHDDELFNKNFEFSNDTLPSMAIEKVTAIIRKVPKKPIDLTVAYSVYGVDTSKYAYYTGTKYPLKCPICDTAFTVVLPLNKKEQSHWFSEKNKQEIRCPSCERYIYPSPNLVQKIEEMVKEYEEGKRKPDVIASTGGYL